MADIGITKFRVQIPRGGATPSTPGFAQSEGQDPVNPPGSPTGIYVPYLGATGAVNLGEFGLSTGNLIFDTTPTNIPTAQGATYWDASKSTVGLIMNGTTQHIGQDQFIYVKNSTGSPIAKGVAVRFAGTDGGSGHILIAPFLANGTYPSAYFMGVTSEAIANGSFGQVQAFGELSGINTSSYTAGDLLYASTTVSGGFQTTAPVAPNNIVLVAAAINSKNNGDIIIRPTIGSNINNDEGVKITSPTTGDLLQLQASGLWENKSLATIGIPTGNIYTANGTLTSNRTVTQSGYTLEFDTRIQVGSMEITNADDYYSVYVSIEGASATGSGYANVGIGYGVGPFGGAANTGLGYYSLRDITTADDNTAVGYESLSNITTGNRNIGLGLSAGIYAGSGTVNNETSTNSIYIGYRARASADGNTKEIVIGYDALGHGSNTVTIGDTSIILTVLRGTVNMANLPTSSTGLNAGDVWNNGGVLNIV